MSAQDLKNRLLADDPTLTELEVCIAYTSKLAPIIAERAFLQLDRLLTRIVELEADALPFTSPDPTPITRDEILAGG